MTVALGVDRDSSGNGLDALTHRRIIKAHWANTGVVTGLACSGRGDLYYDVAPGMAVCSMGDADGYTEAYWAGGKTFGPVTAGDTTYDRIDTVYIRANTGSPDNQVHVDVKQGTPSASPVRATLDVGCVELLSFRMPAGASKTGSAIPLDTYLYAIPYGARLERLGYAENTSTVTQAWDSTWYTQASAKTGILPTDRLVTVDFVYRAGTPNANEQSSFRAKLIVDGTAVTDGQDECMVFNPWARLKCSWKTTLTGGKAHTIAVAIQANLNGRQFTWHGVRYVEVTDGGVAR
jgi:hypothetical protein